MWTLVGVILASYAVQSLLLTDATVVAYAESPADLARGRWVTLITSLFIHAGWVHAGSNAIGALAFAAPAARYLGLGPKGALGFFLLFLACGVAANLGYDLVHWRSTTLVVGASGAVSGLLGASMRLSEHRTRLSPLTNRTVLVSSLAWIGVNWLFGVLHYSPGIGRVNLAWETHVIGYFAGLLLIGPFGALFAAPPKAEDESGEGSIQSEA